VSAAVAATNPSVDDFIALARTNTVVPVWREVLADLETPVSAYRKLVGDADGFLLESVEHGERWGRFSFLGRDPAITLQSQDGIVTARGDVNVSIDPNGGMLKAVETLLAKFRAPQIKELPPFHGGVVGYLGYDVVREVEWLPNIPHDDQHYPDALVTVPSHVAAFDHFRQRITLIENVFIDDNADTKLTDDELRAAYDRAAKQLDELANELARPLPYQPLAPAHRDLTDIPAVTSSMSTDEYHGAVEAAREYIFAGDIFQVVLAQRFDFELEVEPYEVYRVLRQVNPSPYMYFVRNGDITIVGSSPEPMVQLLDGRVISRPIAGTRYRGRTEEHDKRMAAELTEHPKERAEHVMLVDLARNDVGRVVEFGTEIVDELMTLERYSHVMHLTSQVSGTLRPGLGPVDVLRATFPAGTVSGAPKVRAMEIIDELEPVKRGPYAGVVGYLDFSGNLDTAIAIRTMVCQGMSASVQAGAGIVADSDPAAEDLECHNKARALLTAAEAARRLAGGAPRMES
jgi:anthranilate synthase component 1